MNATPYTTLVGGSVTGAIAVVLAWLLGQFGVVMPSDVAVCSGVLIAGAGHWLLQRFGAKAAVAGVELNSPPTTGTTAV